MKSRGHPPLVDDDDSEQVCLTLPAKQYDEYAKRAIKEDVSVPEIIRRDLQAHRKPE